MNVKELVEKLKAFDGELPIVVQQYDFMREQNYDLPVKKVTWEFDSKCRLVI